MLAISDLFGEPVPRSLDLHDDRLALAMAEFHAVGLELRNNEPKGRTAAGTSEGVAWPRPRLAPRFLGARQRTARGNPLPRARFPDPEHPGMRKTGPDASRTTIAPMLHGREQQKDEHVKGLYGCKRTKR
jgi:hypothetical protein